MLYGEQYPELEALVKGSSYRQLFDMLYTLALVRYATPEHLRAVNFKLGTSGKLGKITELDYISFTGVSFYTITDKALVLLERNGYNTKIIKRKLTGEMKEHQAVITSVILDLMKNPQFFAVFYPQFKHEGEQAAFLIPDAAVVFKDEDKVKLIFLEVELSDKPNNYLDNKRKNYLELSSLYWFYDKWWRSYAQKLGLGLCKPEEFCFSIEIQKEKV